MTAPGHDSIAAVAQWARSADGEVLARLGLRFDPLRGAYQVPDERTLRDAYGKVDASALTRAGFARLGALAEAARGDARTPDGQIEREQRRAARQEADTPRRPRRRTAFAVDGKCLRGAKRRDGSQLFVISAVRHHDAVTAAARQIAAKSNEIPAFAPLLDDIDDEQLRGAVVTVDALHAQRDHAAYLVGKRNAHYLVTVKGNQCATRRSDASPPQAEQTRREVCWVRWLTWSRKVKGTRACQETGGRAQVPVTARRGTRAVWRRLDCLNPNLQRQQFTATGTASDTGVRRGRGVLVRLANLRGGSDAQ